MSSSPAADAVESAAAARRTALGIVTDQERILALPRVETTDAEAAEIAADLSSPEWFRRPRAERPVCDLCDGEGGRSEVPGTWEECPACAGDGRLTRPLYPGQGVALRDLVAAPAPRGTVVGIRVGGGKSLVGMLAPVALARAASAGAPAAAAPRRPLALVPAPLVRQWDAMHADWSRDYRLPPLSAYPAVSHDQLSSMNSSSLLDRLRPDLIVIDEAHAFRDLTSARTRRLVRYVVANPGTRVVAMSGSLAADSLRDFAHLLELALREGAPIPLNEHVLSQWCAALDHRGEPEGADWSAIWPVVRAFALNDPGPLHIDSPARIRLADRERVALSAYGRRLRTTPGIVLSRGAVCRAGLRLRLWRPTPPRSIVVALRALLGSWVLPDGTELVDALEMDRHRRTIARGYFYRWRWPDCPECDGRPLTPAEAAAGVTCPACNGTGRAIDTEWMERRRQWSAAVRNALEYGARAGFDSPALVAKAAREGRAGDALRATWEAWAEVAGRWPRGGPPGEVVWLPGARAWLVSVVRTWVERVAGAEGGRGLVWYDSSTALEPVLRDAGLPVYGQGSELPCEHVAAAALSRRVHGTGADGLQYHWHAALVLEPMSSAQAWEQTTARLHRTGQRAPLVRWDVFAPTWVGRAAMEEAIARTPFLIGPGGVGDLAKLAICDWETPLPLEVM
jgi:hypothetical protein